MSIADKLVMIADNMQKIASRVYTRTIDFGADGFAGATTDVKPATFEHGLGEKPTFVAIFADDIGAVKDDGGTYTVQTDCLENAPRSYLYVANGTLTAATMAANESGRLIAGWDAEKIHVYAAGTSRPWPPNTLTKFTMVCVAGADDDIQQNTI